MGSSSSTYLSRVSHIPGMLVTKDIYPWCNGSAMLHPKAGRRCSISPGCSTKQLEVQQKQHGQARLRKDPLTSSLGEARANRRTTDSANKDYRHITLSSGNLIVEVTRLRIMFMRSFMSISNCPYPTRSVYSKPDESD